MQITIPEGFKDDAVQFLAMCNIEATDKQIQSLAVACLVYGIKTIDTAHRLVAHIVSEPDDKPKHEPIPKGCYCPKCEKQIVIQQDMKWRCNCKVWN
jgi:hypothetical protein